MYNVLCGILGTEVAKCFLLAVLIYQVSKRNRHAGD